MRLPEGVERPILRTSGLLSRSNKVMYDLVTYSAFDTFLGHAVTGPLLAEKAGIQLKQASVVITTRLGSRGKREHPDSTVLDMESLRVGRSDSGSSATGATPMARSSRWVTSIPRLPVHEDMHRCGHGRRASPLAFQRSTGAGRSPANRGEAIDCGKRAPWCLPPAASKRRRSRTATDLGESPGLLVCLVAVPSRHRALASGLSTRRRPSSAERIDRE